MEIQVFWHKHAVSIGDATILSKDRSTFIFTVKQSVKKGLLDPEDEGTMAFRPLDHGTLTDRYTSYSAVCDLLRLQPKPGHCVSAYRAWVPCFTQL
jgi:hypothetical protein